MSITDDDIEKFLTTKNKIEAIAIDIQSKIASKTVRPSILDEADDYEFLGWDIEDLEALIPKSHERFYKAFSVFFEEKKNYIHSSYLECVKVDSELASAMKNVETACSRVKKKRKLIEKGRVVGSIVNSLKVQYQKEFEGAISNLQEIIQKRIDTLFSFDPLESTN